MSLNKLLRHLARRRVVALVAILFVAFAGIAVAEVSGDASGSTDPAATAAPETSATPSPSPTETVAEGGSTSSSASGTGGVNNEVVVLNQTDGSFRNRAGVATTRVVGDVVENQNAAAAYSRCNTCRTVAVAVQVVLVQRDASVVSPRNYAIALNYDCQSCETFAGAYQYVVSTDGQVRFTPEGQTQMAALQNEIRATAAMDIPFPELDARLDALVQQLWDVVDSEMVKIGKPFDASPYSDTDTDTEPSDPSPSPTASASPGAEPSTQPGTETPAPESTPQESPSPSPSPSESTSPTPTPTPEGSP